MRDITTKTQSLWYLSSEIGLLIALVVSLHLLKILSVLTLPLDDLLLYAGMTFAIGAGLGFSSLETSERIHFWKYKYVWGLLIVYGFGLSVNGFLLYSKAEATWIITFITGFSILAMGMMLFYASMTDESRESLWRVWPIYLISLLFSLILGFLAFSLFFLSNGGKVEVIIDFSWEYVLSIAAFFGVFGYIPIGFCTGSVESAKEKLGKLSLLWLLLALIGMLLFILSAIEILTGIDVIGGASHREGGLLVGLAFQIPGFVLLGISSGREEFFRKLGPLWSFLILIGVIVAVSSNFTSLPVSTLGLGTMLVIIASGGVYKAISLDYVPEILIGGPIRHSKPMTSTSGSNQSNLTLLSNTISDMTSEEKIFLIDLQKRTNENTIHLLNNAYKSRKLSKEHVTMLVSSFQEANKGYEAEIENVKRQAKLSSRRGIFDKALGTDQATASSPRPMAPQQTSPRPSTAQQPPSTPTATTPPPGPPMHPAPSGPPNPPTVPPGPPMPPGSSSPPSPPTAPPGPPMPPGSSSPPSPSTAPPGPPMPPGSSSPPGPPTAPPGPPIPPGSSSPPGPPTAPPGPSIPPGQPGPPSPPISPSAPDASAPARSTSIAELRGEMLKELRRLKDIFNEDEQ